MKALTCSKPASRSTAADPCLERLGNSSLVALASQMSLTPGRSRARLAASVAKGNCFRQPMDQISVVRRLRLRASGYCR